MAIASVDSFKASLIGGGQRSNQFRVDLTFPQIVAGAATAFPIATAQFFCEATSIPGSTIQRVEAHYRGRQIKLPAEREFEDWKVTILNDTNFQFHTAFNIWMNLINNVRDNTGVTNPLSYTSDMYVTALDRNGSENMTYKIRAAYPIDIGKLELDFKNPDIQKFDVTFSFQDWQSTSIGQV